MELLTLSLFCFALFFCLLFDFSILYALTAGLVLFLLYGKHKGFSWNELARMAFDGIKGVKTILITFVLVGILTALWRDSGTIPVIACYASKLIHPSIFLVMAFILNTLISFITGTAYATAATMGVICATIAVPLEISPILLGGTVLAGSYCGARCSLISSSTLLISELTDTEVFQNVKNFTSSAFIPFTLACLVYLFIGFTSNQGGEIPDLQMLFSKEFVLTWIAVLPAAALLILSVLKIDVKIVMTVSVLISLLISIFIQGTPVSEILQIMVYGFHTTNATLAPMINGGGIVSMVNVIAIIFISSSYSGIFQKTGLLHQLQHGIHALSDKTTPYISMLLTATVTSMVACNLTLTIMLTRQLCAELDIDNETFALYLADTSIPIAPLIPWAITGAVPLASIGSPTISTAFAFFLYFLPMWRCLVTLRKNK